MKWFLFVSLFLFACDTLSPDLPGIDIGCCEAVAIQGERYKLTGEEIVYCLEGRMCALDGYYVAPYTLYVDSVDDRYTHLSMYTGMKFSVNHCRMDSLTKQ